MATPLYGERRLVTILFADLVGHTEILSRVDAEEWQALLHSYFTEMSHPIQRYGGTVEKFIGDAIFAVFGMPRTHEDDAERAVRAAIEMQDRLAGLNPVFQRRLGVPLGLRIAAVTGEVVAPSEEQGGQLVTGELAALAERLQREAPTNGIVLSERTHRLVMPLVEGDFLDPIPLKGFPVAQRAFVVQRLRAGVETSRGVEVSALLVGRERELKVLLEARDRLLAGQGQVVAIVGEAGLGKSRLLAELHDRLGKGIRVVEARCYEFMHATAYGLIVQLLRRYLELAEDDPPEIGRVQLGAALYKLFGSPPSDVRQALEYLLGLDSSREFEASVRGLAPEQVRSRMVQTISVFWEGVAAKVPLLLIVEDFHWVDSASASALPEILPLMEKTSLTLLCAFRPDRRSLAWEFKVASDRDYPHRYREVRLEPLSLDDTERLAGALLEKVGSSADLKHDVAQRAEGNPFYVEEVVRSLQRHSDPAGTLVQLPDTLQGVLQARLDGLPSGTRRVLQTASVIGRTFPLRLLATASGMNGDLAAHLSVLQRTEFLVEQQRRPERQFAFKHVLLQQAAYQTILRDERRGIHRRLAVALEEEISAGTDLATLVRHFLLGEEWEKAFFYANRAAEAARSLSAFDAALEQYEIALRIASQHPAEVPDDSMLFRARKGRGEILSFLGRSKEALQHFEQLLTQHAEPNIKAQIYQSIGRLHRDFGNLEEAQTNLERALQFLEIDPDPEAEAGVHWSLAQVLERQRSYGRALEHAQKALATAKKHGLHPQMRDIYIVLSMTHFYGGSPEQSIRYAEESLSFSLQGNDQYRIALAHNWLAHLLLFMGNVTAARQQAEEAKALAIKLGIGPTLAVVHLTVVQILLEQSRWEEAADVLAFVETTVHRHSLGEGWRARVCREQGFLALTRGLWDEAVKRFEEALALVEKLGLARDLPKIHRGLAEAYLGMGNLGRALLHASKVVSCEQGGSPIETPGALRITAMAAREKGDLQHAFKLLDESGSLLRVRGASGEYARLNLELARTYSAAGQTAQALGAAEESMKAYQALEALPLVELTARLVKDLRGGEGGSQNEAT